MRRSWIQAVYRENDPVGGTWLHVAPRSSAGTEASFALVSPNTEARNSIVPCCTYPHTTVLWQSLPRLRSSLGP